MGTNSLVNVSQKNDMTMTLFQNVNIAILKKKRSRPDSENRKRVNRWAFCLDDCVHGVFISLVAWYKFTNNKYAFQWDAYRPLVARISQHALRRGGVSPGGCVSAPRGVSAPGRRGCLLWWRKCLLQGGTLLLWAGFSAPGGRVCSGGCVCSWGLSAQAGCVSQHALRQTPPEWLTDKCKNITFTNFVCGQ